MRWIKKMLTILVVTVCLLGLVVGVAWLLLTQPMAPVARVDNVPPVDAARLEQHVRVLAEELPPRGDNPDHLKTAARYIAEQFTACGGKPEWRPFQVDGLTYYNVVSRLGRETGPKLVIGAHYDTAGGLPGADDNGSAVAGLIELACLLLKREQLTPLAMPVELVAFALEEPPHFGSSDMGSHHHAAALRRSGDNVALMISLEMIGYFDDTPGSQTFPLPWMKHWYSDKGNFIAVVGRIEDRGAARQVKRSMRRATDLPVYSLNAPPLLGGLDLSDHGNYWQYDFSAVMVTDTAFYRNFAYHTPNDTPERLDYVRMARVVQGVYQVVMDFEGLANSDV